ncbi:hypothetical protein [Streptomyces sp. NPDC020996]|uniref:hypothetical protein n=1 Tax=Streptomyces sp. NPDC020996 TaxID=3154791 RepID=UPI0033DAF7C5
MARPATTPVPPPPPGRPAPFAAVLRDHPDSAQHFSHIADNRTADPRIRQALRTSTAG